MTLRAKLAVAATLAVIAGSTAFTTNDAEAKGWKHFHRGPFVGWCYGNRKHHACWGHRRHFHGWGYGVPYRYGYVGACGWQRITVKKWNAAHTKLIVIRDKVWRCY
jgi:hypothetical protein